MKKLLIVLFFAMICSCNKEVSPKSETSIGKLIIEKGIKEKITPNTIGIELGLQFSAIKKGKITQIGAKMPELGIYTVSIWDVATKKIIRQKQVEQGINEKLTLVNIDPLPIEKDVKYVISIFTKSNNSSKPYFASDIVETEWPFSIGNLLFHLSNYDTSNIDKIVYPIYEIKSRFYSNIDLTFVAD